ARGASGRTRLAGGAARRSRERRGVVRRGHAGRDLRDAPSMNGPFEAGEKILLVDQRDRRYLLTLQTGETWHSHGGGLPHDLLIGCTEGTLVHSATGVAFRALRAALA